MIYNKEINGVKFTFVCESWTNRNGWGHKVTLYKNNVLEIGTCKVRYYNRTWECYLYQSAIRSVIRNVINELTEREKTAFKKSHEYKIMTKKRLAKFSEYLKQDSTYCMYNELYRMF